MAITLASSGTVASTESTALAVTLPPGIEANDICLWHTHAQKSTFAHAYPVGWTIPVGTILNEAVSTRTLGISFAWQRMAGGESGQVSVTHGGASTSVVMAAISLWRGVSTGSVSPYSTLASTTANSSLYNTEGLALSDTNHVCVYLMSIADDQATMSSLSSQVGLDPLTIGYNTEVALGGGSILGMQYAQATSSGTAQGGTERHGTVEVWSAFEIALMASTDVPLFTPPGNFCLMGIQ